MGGQGQVGRRGERAWHQDREQARGPGGPPGWLLVQDDGVGHGLLPLLPGSEIRAGSGSAGNDGNLSATAADKQGLPETFAVPQHSWAGASPFGGQARQ